MKTRHGFVSNSSSSSFVISLNHLSAKQLRMIEHHGPVEHHADEWRIHVDEEEGTVTGHTDMDNFDMSNYLKEKVKVDKSKIRWLY